MCHFQFSVKYSLSTKLSIAKTNQSSLIKLPGSMSSEEIPLMMNCGFFEMSKGRFQMTGASNFSVSVNILGPRVDGIGGNS